MANLRVQRRRANRGEDGASLVEFALILPVFVVLVFGMITGGIALSHQNSVKNAVREASRFAAVSDVGTTPAELTTYLDSVIEQVEDASTGDLGDDVEGNRVCVAYTSDGTTFTSRVKNGASIANGSGSCFVDSVGTRARTQVLAERRTEIGAIFFEVPIDLRSQSVSRYERG